MHFCKVVLVFAMARLMVRVPAVLKGAPCKCWADMATDKSVGRLGDYVLHTAPKPDC